MRIEQLEYFLEIAKTGSINRAAENLFLTQPGLSSAVKSMEKELDTTLLIRTSSGINLTRDGQVIAEQAGAVLDAYQKMLNSLSTYADPDDPNLEGYLSITASPVFFSTILMAAINEFNLRFPNIHIKATESDEGHILGMVHNQVHDLGFLAPTDTSLLQSTHHDLVWAKLFTDEIVAAISSASPLATVDQLSYDDLRGERFSTFLTNPSLPQTTNHNFFAISNNVSTHIALVSGGQSICIIPNFLSYLFQQAAANIVIRHFSPKMHITFFMISSTSHKRSAAEKAFIRFMDTYLASHFTFDAIFHNRP